MNKCHFRLASISFFVVFGVKVQQANTNYSFDNLPVVKETVFKKDTISIEKFGAINDGGGVVLVPKSVLLQGIDMKKATKVVTYQEGTSVKALRIK